jgi:hypothetical protein
VALSVKIAIVRATSVPDGFPGDPPVHIADLVLVEIAGIAKGHLDPR